MLYWVWGCSLLSIFELSSTLWQTKWSAFLSYHGITSRNYDRHRLKASNVAYVKLPNKLTKAYVGSTSGGMQHGGILHREGTRRRKYKQHGLPHAEPAIVWWKRSKTFFMFCPIVWFIGSDIDQAVVQEIRAIDIRKPELNTPFVQTLLRRKHFRPGQPGPTSPS